VKAVVVLSGGQDSATALALATRRHGADQVAAITFAYGQRHQLETKFARALAKRFKIAKHKIVKMNFMGELAASALIVGSRSSKSSSGSNAEFSTKCGMTCPTTVVEGRNAFFLMAGAVWAKELGATEVWTGVSQADFSGYPDCREAFVKAQQKAARLALEWPIRIITPFMKMTKADEWQLAAELGILDVIENLTLTCYNGIPGKGCGKCPACKLRNRGYAEFRKRTR